MKTHPRTGILTVSWSDLLSSNLVGANVHDENTGELVSVPLGAKLTSMCMVPSNEDTKRALELVEQVHSLISPQPLNTKARVYLGSSTSPIDINNHNTFPAGTLAPLNTKPSYAFLRPSFTSDKGRAVGELHSPLFIQTILCDCAGLRADPTSNKPMPNLICALFAMFKDDIAINGTKGMAGLTALDHTNEYFSGELSFTILFEYVTVSLPTKVTSNWGDTQVKL